MRSDDLYFRSIRHTVENKWTRTLNIYHRSEGELNTWQANFF